jgi:hypothetical protein
LADRLVLRNTTLFDTSQHVDAGDLVTQVGRPCLIAPAAVVMSQPARM